jgi:hypothetical protein
MSDVTSGGTVQGRENRIALLVVLGVVAIVAIALMGFWLLGGDGDADLALELPPAPDQAADPEPEQDVLAAELAALPTVTYDVFLSRDPFDPVVPEPEPPPPADDGTQPVAVTDATQPMPAPEPGDPTDPAQPGEPVPDLVSGDPPTGDCRGEDEVICDGQVVTLVGIERGEETTANIQVGTTIWTVRVGEVFAGYFQVRAIDDGCVSLLYGDDGFTLCEGERVLK